MKDHEIREAINELRDVAIKYRDAEQLRSRIAGAVHGIVEKCNPKMKKVEDLKVGDRIRIIATDYHRKPFKNNFAKIIDIAFEDFGYIHTINFEGDPKDHTTTLQLQCYQTEYEVIPTRSRSKLSESDPPYFTHPSEYKCMSDQDKLDTILGLGKPPEGWQQETEIPTVTVYEGIADEVETLKKQISDIPECDCLCENSMEEALLKVEIYKKVKENKYLADENTWWPMP